MKKQILVTAIAMAFGLPLTALAQTVPEPISVKVGTDTAVSISGLFAVGFKDSQVSGSSKSYQNETRVDDNTSRITFSGVSKFDNGLRGIFRVESRFTTDTRPGTPLAPGQTAVAVNDGTGWADGDTWVGLAGDFGQVIMGKSSLYYADTLNMGYLGVPGAGEGYRVWDGNGLATFNLLSQVANNLGPIATLGISRSQNVIRYDSPKMSGVDVAVAYTQNPTGDETHVASCTPSTCAGTYTDGGTYYARVRYDQGPLNASLSYLNQKIAGGVYNPVAYSGPLNTQAYRAGVGYTLDMGLRVGLVYDHTSIDNGISGTTQAAARDVYSIPVSYAWGKNQAYFTYTQAGATSNLSSSGATQYNMGYDYALSKTTFVGVMWTKLANDTNGRYTPFLTNTALGGTAPGVGESWQQLSFDINYWF